MKPKGRREIKKDIPRISHFSPELQKSLVVFILYPPLPPIPYKYSVNMNKYLE